MITTLRQTQFLPVTLEKAWQYFSNPANLNDITPEYMSFEIRSDIPDKVYPGLLICYRIVPMFNLPMSWVTEITHVKEQDYFIDEQRFGPFAMWHHEHHFKAVEGGVMMTDLLSYRIGKSMLGYIAGKLLVHRRVKDIFAYRCEKLKLLFPQSR